MKHADPWSLPEHTIIRQTPDGPDGRLVINHSRDYQRFGGPAQWRHIRFGDGSMEELKSISIVWVVKSIAQLAMDYLADTEMKRGKGTHES